ncbi:hypothetical protein LY76DRAFT_73551 [Colletotrichum caudatum]|nr:hypothetical protein LY76DRAFT_73551 [Colletotrichum caudatum]
MPVQSDDDVARCLSFLQWTDGTTAEHVPRRIGYRVRLRRERPDQGRQFSWGLCHGLLWACRNQGWPPSSPGMACLGQHGRKIPDEATRLQPFRDIKGRLFFPLLLMMMSLLSFPISIHPSSHLSIHPSSPTYNPCLFQRHSCHHIQLQLSTSPKTLET